MKNRAVDLETFESYDQKSISVVFFATVWGLIVAAILGFVATLAFWKTWDYFTGSIPQVGGLSRLWPDSFGVFFYLPLVLWTFGWLTDESKQRQRDWTLLDEDIWILDCIAFCFDRPKHAFVAAVLTASLAVGIYYTLIVGLGFFVLLTLYALAIYNIPKGLQKVLSLRFCKM